MLTFHRSQSSAFGAKLRLTQHRLGLDVSVDTFAVAVADLCQAAVVVAILLNTNQFKLIHFQICTGLRFFGGLSCCWRLRSEPLRRQGVSSSAIISFVLTTAAAGSLGGLSFPAVEAKYNKQCRQMILK